MLEGKQTSQSLIYTALERSKWNVYSEVHFIFDRHCKKRESEWDSLPSAHLSCYAEGGELGYETVAWVLK